VEKFEHPAIFLIPNFLPSWLIKGPFIPDHIAMAWLVIVILGFVSFLATRSLKDVPGPLQNFMEVTIETFYNLLESIIGPEGRRYLPRADVMEALQRNKSPTSNLNTTLALAVTVFLAYHAIGMRKRGVLGYLKHFAGPVWWLSPLMFPVEVISHLSRPMSLSIRLFGNIFGEDTVILVLAGLVAVKGIKFSSLVVPLPMMFLAIFTSVVQTLVFVMLSTIYIAGAVEVEHEEHH